MTILQLKYVIAVANAPSLREAASGLFISQPALSLAIRELEEELNVRLFERTNKGIRITKEGEEFLVYAKEAVSQYRLVEERYLGEKKEKEHFSVSMQHYVFAVNAFVNVVKKTDSEKYVFSVHETRTDEVLNNVRNLKSEIGIISYTAKSERILKKLFREYGLSFHPLLKRDTYVYLWKKHPLAKRNSLSLKDLEDYPCITFDQSSDSEFYLHEEALSDYESGKIIKTNDRATSAELMASLNGYSIGTGIMTESSAIKNDYCVIKLEEEDPLIVGYIVRDNHDLSDIGKLYIEELKKYKEELK